MTATPSGSFPNIYHHSNNDRSVPSRIRCCPYWAPLPHLDCPEPLSWTHKPLRNQKGSYKIEQCWQNIMDLSFCTIMIFCRTKVPIHIFWLSDKCSPMHNKGNHTLGLPQCTFTATKSHFLYRFCCYMLCLIRIEDNHTKDLLRCIFYTKL